MKRETTRVISLVYPVARLLVLRGYTISKVSLLTLLYVNIAEAIGLPFLTVVLHSNES